MSSVKTNDIFLVFQMIIVLAYHCARPIVVNYLNQLEKINQMNEFNLLLDQNSVPENILKCLKILIHNYENLPNKNILNSRNESELHEAVLNLKIQHQPIFLKSTKTLNCLVFGATVMPCIVYLIKKIIKKKN